MLSTQELAWLKQQNIGEVTAVEQFKHALTNDVFLVSTHTNTQFVFKRLNQQARSQDDRQAEALVQQLAKQHNLTPEVLAYSNAYKLQRYIPGDLIAIDIENLPQLLAHQLHRIHLLPAKHAPKQRLFFELQQLKSQLPVDIDDNVFHNMSLLANKLDKTSSCDTLCHGDLSLNNVLLGCNGLYYIIDWEYAVIACPAYDLAFCNCINAFNVGQSQAVIEEYYLQLSDPHYSLESLQNECQLYLKLFNYINELWAICFLEKQ